MVPDNFLGLDILKDFYVDKSMVTCVDISLAIYVDKSTVICVGK